MVTKTEAGGMQPQPREAWSPGSWKRQEALSPRALGGSKVPPTPQFWTSGLQIVREDISIVKITQSIRELNPELGNNPAGWDRKGGGRDFK